MYVCPCNHYLAYAIDLIIGKEKRGSGGEKKEDFEREGGKLKM